MNQAARIIFTFIGLIVGFQTNANAQEWELQKEHENIKVFFRKTKPSKYEIRVNATYNFSQKDLINIVSDYSSFPQWVYRCIKVENIKLGNKEYVRTVTSMPWPLKDRDVVVEVLPNQHKSKDIIILSSDSRPDDLPVYENIIRQKGTHVVWEIKAINSKQCFVDYFLTLEINEEFPDFIMKMISTHGPYETFKKLNDYINKS